MLQNQEAELFLADQDFFYFFFFSSRNIINQCAFSAVHLKWCSDFDEIKGEKNHFSSESEAFYFKECWN